MRRDRDGDDEAWAPHLVQCRRPPKPREAGNRAAVELEKSGKFLGNTS